MKKLIGYIGEVLVVLIYFCQGYKILHRRYKSKFAEVDIIAKKDNTLIFIEVKTRLTHFELDQVISYKQKNRIKLCAKSFLLKNKYKFYNIRLDLAIIKLGKPIIIKNAW